MSSLEFSETEPTASAEESNLSYFRSNLSKFAFDSPTPSSPRKRGIESQDASDALPAEQITLVSPQKAAKRQKRARGYAPPETYSHLNELNDCLKGNLDVMFCGINPGFKSAETGHHFAHHSNHFWKCLHEGGFTPTRLPPSEDHLLPQKFNLGLTNLVDRPSREQSELHRSEEVAGVLPLLRKVIKYRPRIICFVGIGIWGTVELYLRSICSAPTALEINDNIKPVGEDIVETPQSRLRKSEKRKRPETRRPGLQPYKLVYNDCAKDTPNERSSSQVDETLFFCVPSTSARVTAFRLEDKVVYFEDLKQTTDKLKLANQNTEHEPTNKAGQFNIIYAHAVE